MRLVIVILLLLAPLAGLAAPIQRVSYSYTIVNPVETLQGPPICYHRWRYHGHLTFRLARLDSCRAWTVEQANTTDMDGADGEAEHCSRKSEAMVGKPWTG